MSRSIMSIGKIAYEYLWREWRLRCDNISYYRKLGAHIGEDCIIHCTVNFGSEPYLISLGNHVRINKGVELITHDGGLWFFRETSAENRNIALFGRIQIGNNVHVGTIAIIMPDVRIGDNCVIGCGAIVTHDIPNNTVAAGVPARIIETIDEYWRKNHARFDYTKKMDSERLRSYLTAKYCVEFPDEKRGQ